MHDINCLESGNVRSRHTGGGVVGLLIKNPKLNSLLVDYNCLKLKSYLCCT